MLFRSRADNGYEKHVECQKIEFQEVNAINTFYDCLCVLDDPIKSKEVSIQVSDIIPGNRETQACISRMIVITD